MAFSILAIRQVLVVRLEADIDAALAQEIEELRALAGGTNPATGEPFGGDSAAILDTFLERSVPGEYEAFLALLDGEPYKRTVAPVSLFDDTDLLATWAAVSEPTWGSRATGAGPVRWLAVPLDAGDRVGGLFVVTHFEAEQRSQIDRAIQVMVVILLLALAVGSLAAWAAAGRAIAPLRRLTATAHAVGDRDLAARIPVEGTDEVAELTETLNSMLARLESTFADQRAFLDDVGHELRTPITIARGHLELLDDDPAERQETIALVIDELDRMSRQVDDLLLLARAERPDFLRVRPTELGELLTDVLARVRPLGDRVWEVAAPSGVAIVADPDRLTQALVNLAGNAVRHTPEGGRIELGARVVGGEAFLWVADEGAGIAPADQARIFERFTRGSDIRTRESEGSGLGLAIVGAIANAHGGRVELTSAVGQGSTFTVVVPVEPDQEEGQA
jgi:signal transduction histidine kinase